MSLSPAAVDENISHFLDLLPCMERIAYWRYDADGNLIHTTSDNPVMEILFRDPGTHAYMMDMAGVYSRPLVLTNKMELVWCAVFEKDGGRLRHVHVLGPVFISQYAYRRFEDHLHTSKISLRWKPKLLDYLRNLPLVTLDQFFRPALMLHYSVTGERIAISDIRYQQTVSENAGTSSPTRRRDAARSWMAEQTIMNSIREGRPFEENQIAELLPYTAFVKVNLRNTLASTKLPLSIYASLCARAAIDGGMSPDDAFSRSDAYTQSIMEAQAVTEILDLARTMYDDFVAAVARIRTDRSLSAPVRSCCDYMRLHPEEEITLASLAAHAGYTEYYLSRKFKEETGQTVREYLKKARLDEACRLIQSTRMSLLEISEKLQFGNRSFFTREFKKYTGQTPAAYLAAHRRL